jgi:hypothetical protein
MNGTDTSKCTRLRAMVKTIPFCSCLIQGAPILLSVR